MLATLSITAIVFAVLVPLYCTLRKDLPSPPASLAVALAISALLEFFDLMTICYPEQFYFWMKFSLASEALLLPAWLWFSLTSSRRDGHRMIPVPHRIMLVSSIFIVVFTLILPVHSFVFSPDNAAGTILYLGSSGDIFYVLMFIFLIAAMTQLEVTLVHTTLPSRGKIKLELFGAGTFLAILGIYYSQGFLFHTINTQLAPMRTIGLIGAIALIFHSRLKRGACSVHVHVSELLARRSMVLLAAGLYVIGFGLTGEGMKHFGDGFVRTMVPTMFILSCLGMLVIILSDTIKRKATVFIHKCFCQNKYDYRTQWLQFTERLSSSLTREEILNSIVSEFCVTFGMGAGSLLIRNQEQGTYRQSSAVAMASTDAEFASNDPCIESMVRNRWIVDLHDTADASEYDHHRDFFRINDVRFMIPLFTHEGVDGFILLGKQLNSDEIYGGEDFDLMKALATQASSALLNLRLSDQLACSRELAAIGKVSAFVMHDLKNLVSSVSLLLENAQEHITVPAFQDDLLMSLGNTLIKMKALVSRLKYLPEKNLLHMAPVDLLQMAHETAALVNRRTVAVTGSRVIAEADKEELQKVALNLMLNAVEATDENRRVVVEVGEKESPYFRVKDEGCGISETFLKNLLFTPFTSTKKAGLGIGLYQSKQIVEAHGGTIEVVSAVNHGSEFTVWLPKMQPAAT